MDTDVQVADKPAVTPKPQYLTEARDFYHQKLKEFSEKRDELVASRNAFKSAAAQFKAENTEKQTEIVA